MSFDSSHPPTRPPHVLARDLLRRLEGHSGAVVLEVGRGSGRNTAALAAAGHRVVELADGMTAEAAISTHALLHGTRGDVRALLAGIAAHLLPGAPFYGTFGSTRDARYGAGTRIEEGCFAPADGDEAGVPHAFFDRETLLALFEPDWHVERLEEVRVDEIAGSWAHGDRPLRDAYHWFAVLRRQ